jgi:hypothetical protein
MSSENFRVLKETDYTKNSKLSADFCQKNQPPPHCSAIGGSQDVRFSTFESPLVDFLFQNFFRGDLAENRKLSRRPRASRLMPTMEAPQQEIPM